MFSTDEDRNVMLAPLFADLIQDILDKGALYKAPAESHIEIERVGDSRDAGHSRDAPSSPAQPVPLETSQLNDGPTEGPAAVPLITIFKGKQAKNMLAAESGVDLLGKDKLRQRIRLMFAPDVGTPAAMQVKQPKGTSLGTKLTPSPNMARLETRLDTLAKRLLTLESNMDTLCLKMTF